MNEVSQNSDAILFAIIERSLQQQLTNDELRNLAEQLFIGDLTTEQILANIQTTTEYYQKLRNVFESTTSPHQMIVRLKEYFLHKAATQLIVAETNEESHMAKMPSIYASIPIQPVMQAEQRKKTENLRTLNVINLFTKLVSLIRPDMNELADLLNSDEAHQSDPTWFRKAVEHHPQLSPILWLLPTDLTYADLNKLCEATEYSSTGKKIRRFGDRQVAFTTPSLQTINLSGPLPKVEPSHDEEEVRFWEKSVPELLGEEKTLTTLTLNLEETELDELYNSILLPFLQKRMLAQVAMTAIYSSKYYHKISELIDPDPIKAERAIRFIGLVLTQKVLGTQQHEN